ncbi:MAG: response regulator, partial [Proteobacteria bacterium]|nr:response regulator [Pseudomonadota bacterium]
QRALVSTALESGKGLLTILNDILDVSKLEAGRLELETTDFELAALVSGVVDLQTSHAAAKGVELAATIRPGTPADLAGDPGRIRQVLHNLVSNAVKFTADGQVSIVVSGQTRQTDVAYCLRVEVADTGIGIAKDRQDELFTEFTQLDVSYARRFGGTGLGLSISKKLVDLMDGEIGVTSQQGEGSRFWFSIPLGIAADRPSEVKSEAQPVVPSRAEPFEPHKARLLLAEDNTANQMVARLMLRQAGYQLDIVGNGIEAVEAVTNRPYDLVLMDAAMPEMDGLEATRRIRALPGPRADIPIIATTANAMSGDREACLAAGMTGYLAKPFDKARLVAAVQGALAPDNAPPRRDDPGLIESEALHGLARDIDAGVLGELIECFIDDAEGRVARIIAAAGHADVAALEHESHALSSSCATFGAKRLGELAEAIERASRAGDVATAAALGGTIGDLAAKTFAAVAQTATTPATTRDRRRA